MKKLILLVISVALIYGFIQEQSPSISNDSPGNQRSNTSLQTAYENRQSDIQVQGEGTVLGILPDDNDGSRHQRFLLKLSTGQTLLIAHNIDLAPRVTELKRGDLVEFYGEYEWNSKGGVIHWTHLDPNNNHVGGWLKHGGKSYQ